MLRSAAFVALVAAACLPSAQAYFYIPGTVALSYADDQPVNITVNSLRSLSTVVPYEYYKLPFCKPRNITTSGEGLGQLLAGDAMMTSLYQLPMKMNIACQPLDCPAGNADEVKARVDELKTFIDQGYRGHMSIDNLPGYNNGTKIFEGRCNGIDIPVNWQNFYMRGYAIGVPAWCTGKTMLNNHLEFTVKYHQPDPDQKKYRVVGFVITPRSVSYEGGLECNPAFEFSPTVIPLQLEGIKAGTQKPIWTYSVKWIEDKEVSWVTRWDAYLNTSFADSHGQVHWTYIINSLLVAMCLSVIAGMMLCRTLYKECNAYNAQDPESLAEEVGWKLVHADVFRPPQHSSLLAIAVGNGTQFVLVAFATIFFALLGFLSPANRGGLLQALLITFALFSFASGYVTSRVLKVFDKKAWKTVFGSAMLFPGSLFGVFFIVDLVNWHMGASDAVPLTSILTVLGLWLGSCVPLNVLGAAYGFNQDAISFPCKVGRLAREIPEQKWWLKSPTLYIIVATFPFSAIFLELRFIFDSIWLGGVYYAFTFLALVFVVWVATIIVSTMIGTYYLLVHGEYRWWWRSFLMSGALGAHVYLYAIYFYMTLINITSKTGTFIYFTYMGFLAVAYGLAAGTIGFLTALVFVRKIYGSIRID